MLFIFLFQPHVPVRLPCYDFIPVMNFIIIPKKINPLLKIEKILILKYPLKRFQIKLTPGM